MKKNILSIILLVFVLIMSGCSSTKNKLIPTANKGGYKVNVIKTKTNNYWIQFKHQYDKHTNDKKLHSRWGKLKYTWNHLKREEKPNIRLVELVQNIR